MRTVEKHDGIVSDNNDPEQKGGLLVKCEALIDPPESYPDWIRPKFAYGGGETALPFGIFFVPEVGAKIEVEIETEGPVQNVYWRAALYDDSHPIPEDLKTNYPNRKGIVTPSGHIFLFDDTKDKELMSYLHPKGSGIIVDPDGSVMITVAAPGGTMALYMSAIGDGFVLIDDVGNLINMDDQGNINVMSKTGTDMVTISDGQVQLMTSGDIVLAGNVLVRGAALSLGDGGAEFVCKYTPWNLWSAAHMHLPSTVTIPAGTPIMAACKDGAPVVTETDIVAVVTNTGTPVTPPPPNISSAAIP